jgi:2-C-methyl-D-erythritol 4-phosphate cytidylyltransferase
MSMDKNRDKESTVGAVIVAAGSGLRMGGGDKLFAPLCGELLLARVLGVFAGCKAVDRIAVVVREEKVTETQELISERGWSKVREVCIGGARRQDSVRAGLERLRGCEWVVVHDGARPLVTGDLIESGLKAAADTGAAVAAVPVTDTIKVAGPDRVVRYTPARDSMWAVQTPQVFRYDILKRAYRKVKGEVTDDATVVEQLGHHVVLYRGSYDNIKITSPNDLILAEVLLQKRG